MFTEEVLELDLDVSRMQVASARVLRRVGEVDEQRVWESEGLTSTSRWLAHRYHLVLGTAREWVRMARALRRLPRIALAFEEGELSFDQVRPLTKFATEETDAHWAQEALSWSAGALWEEAIRLREIRVRDEEDDRKSRYLDLSWDEEKRFLFVTGRFDAEQGTILESALKQRAQNVKLLDDPYDPQGAKLADSLVDLVSGSPKGKRAQPLLIIHADARVLTQDAPGDGLLSETESGSRLSFQAVRRLSKGANIEWVLAENGRCVGVGFQRRRPPDWLARRVRERDGAAASRGAAGPTT